MCDMSVGICSSFAIKAQLRTILTFCLAHILFCDMEVSHVMARIIDLFYSMRAELLELSSLSFMIACDYACSGLPLS